MKTIHIEMKTVDGCIMVTEIVREAGKRTNADIPDIRFIDVETAEVRK